jgi:hypothetical protein
MSCLVNLSTDGTLFQILCSWHPQPEKAHHTKTKGDYQMKKTVIVLLSIAAFAATAFASGPESIVLPASIGTVTFPHKMHQEMLKDCKKCHEKGPGKIADLGKEWAHKTCKGCHTEMKKGPVGCKDCHKK